MAVLTSTKRISTAEIQNRPFSARYPGRCALTGYNFRPGQEIRRRDDGSYISEDGIRQLGYTSDGNGGFIARRAAREEVDIDVILAEATTIEIAASAGDIRSWKKLSDGRWDGTGGTKSVAQLRRSLATAFAIRAEK